MRTLLRSAKTRFALFLVALVPLVAFAQGTTVVDPSVDLAGFIAQLFEKTKSGEWQVVAAMALVGTVWLVRRFIGPKVPWFKTDRGGAALVLVLGILGAVANALLAAGPGAVTLGLLGTAVVTAVKAAGGFAIVRKILWPADLKAVGAAAAGAAAAKVDPAPTLNQ